MRKLKPKHRADDKTRTWTRVFLVYLNAKTICRTKCAVKLIYSVRTITLFLNKIGKRKDQLWFHEQDWVKTIIIWEEWVLLWGSNTNTLCNCGQSKKFKATAPCDTVSQLPPFPTMSPNRYLVLSHHIQSTWTPEAYVKGWYSALFY